MAQKSRTGVALKEDEEKLTVRLRVNLTKEDYEQLMKHYDAKLYRSKSAYYRSVLVRNGRHGDVEKASQRLADHTVALEQFTEKLNQVILRYRQKFPFSKPANLWKHVTDSIALRKESARILGQVQKLSDPQAENNHT